MWINVKKRPLMRKQAQLIEGRRVLCDTISFFSEQLRINLFSNLWCSLSFVCHGQSKILFVESLHFFSLCKRLLFVFWLHYGCTKGRQIFFTNQKTTLRVFTTFWWHLLLHFSFFFAFCVQLSHWLGQWNLWCIQGHFVNSNSFIQIFKKLVKQESCFKIIFCSNTLTYIWHYFLDFSPQHFNYLLVTLLLEK